MIQVVDQAGLFPGLTYRGSGWSRTDQPNIYEIHGAASYVTGAHALKVGISEAGGTIGTGSPPTIPVTAYRFNNGVPNQLTQVASPSRRESTIRELGVYVQDQWTVGRLTLNGGLRFDHARTSFPETSVGPMPLAPTLHVTFPATDWYNLKDLSPRLGAAYDLFGNGRTAVKVSLSKYLAGLAATAGNPVGNLALSTTRAWTDANRDYVPDCDLLNPLQNGECGAMANRLFGQPVATERRRAGHRARMGQAHEELGVLGQHPARDDPAGGAPGGFLPSVVRQLPGDRQPRRGAVRLHRVQRDRALRSATPERRWLPRDRPLQPQPRQGGAGRQPDDVRAATTGTRSTPGRAVDVSVNLRASRA